jgi:hypothetical protein
MPNTLLLDRTTWDLVLDNSGSIALASEPYSIAQDVASAIKTRLGEVWYNTTVGVPYGQILGKFPPVQFVKAQLVAAAMTVPGVTAAVCFLAGITDRALSGQVLVTDVTGATTPVAF